MIGRSAILGVILAGGKASRLGGQDKALLELGGQPIISHVIAAATPQVGQLLISANHSLERYAELGLPLVQDREKAYAGPLVGLYSAMTWAESVSADKRFRYLACFPGDVPWFPGNIVSTLASALSANDCQLAWSRCAGQVQPLFSLWALSLKDQLYEELQEGRVGPTMVIPRLRSVLVDFVQQDVRSFFNINTEADLEFARELLKRD